MGKLYPRLYFRPLALFPPPTFRGCWRRARSLWDGAQLSCLLRMGGVGLLLGASAAWGCSRTLIETRKALRGHPSWWFPNWVPQGLRGSAEIWGEGENGTEGCMAVLTCLSAISSRSFSNF
jgi:hypothetical protein